MVKTGWDAVHTLNFGRSSSSKTSQKGSNVLKLRTYFLLNLFLPKLNLLFVKYYLITLCLQFTISQKSAKFITKTKERKAKIFINVSRKPWAPFAKYSLEKHSLHLSEFHWKTLSRIQCVTELAVEGTALLLRTWEALYSDHSEGIRSPAWSVIWLPSVPQGSLGEHFLPQALQFSVQWSARQARLLALYCIVWLLMLP
jgi:hypothetical protein